MTFPSVNGRNSNQGSANATTYTAALPTSIANRELLIAAIANDGTTALSYGSGLAGWFPFFDATDTGTAACRLSLYYKIADGSESGNLSIVGASEAFCGRTLRISNYDQLTPPEVASAGDGGTGSTNPNPPSLNPANWGTEDALWLAIYGGDGNVNASAAPTNYTTNAALLLATNGTTGDRCALGFGERTLNAASEDPGTFTRNSEDWIAATVAIRGVQASPHAMTPLRQSTFYTTGSPTSDSFTLDAGTNRRLFVCVITEDTGVTHTGVTYGGQSLSLVTDGTDTANVAASDTAGRTSWWTLLEASLPSNGANTLAVTLSAATEAQVTAVVIPGCSQATNVADVANNSSTGATSITASPSIAVNDSLVLMAGYANNNVRFTTSTIGGSLAMALGCCNLPTDGAFTGAFIRGYGATTGSQACVLGTGNSVRTSISAFAVSPGVINDVATATFAAGAASMAIPGGGGVTETDFTLEAVQTGADPTFNVDVVAGTDRAFVVAIGLPYAASAVNADPTLGGQALSIVTDGTTSCTQDDASYGHGITYYILFDADFPADGTQTLSIPTVGAGTEGYWIAWWFVEDAAQDANVVDVAIATSDSNDPLSLTGLAASAAGEMVFAACVSTSPASGTTLTVDSTNITQVTVDNDPPSSFPHFWKAGHVTASGAGSITASVDAGGTFESNSIIGFVLGTTGGGGSSAVTLARAKPIGDAAFQAGAASMAADALNFKGAPAIPGLVWWRGTDLSDGAVASWPDSIQGVTVAQGTGDNQPVAADGIVSFDGTNDRLVLNATNPFSAELTQLYIAAWMFIDTAATVFAVSRGGASASTTRLSLLASSTSSIFASGGNGTGPANFQLSDPTSGWHFVEIWYDGSQAADDRLSGAVDGAALGAVGAYVGGNRMAATMAASDVISIGCLDGAGTPAGFWNSEIAHVYLAPDLPDDTQRAALMDLESPAQTSVEVAAFASGPASMAADALVSRSISTAAFTAGAATFDGGALARSKPVEASFAAGAASFSADARVIDEVIQVAAFASGPASFDGGELARSKPVEAAFQAGTASFSAGTLARSKPLEAAFAAGAASFAAQLTIADTIVSVAAFQAGPATFDGGELARTKPATAAFASGPASFSATLDVALSIGAAAFQAGSASFSATLRRERSVSSADFAAGPASMAAVLARGLRVSRAAFDAGSASFAATLSRAPGVPGLITARVRSARVGATISRATITVEVTRVV